MFRRNSRFIQDKSVAGNAGVAGYSHKKGRNYEVLINQRNGRKMGRFHNFNQEIVQSGSNPRSSVPRGCLEDSRRCSPCLTDRFGLYIRDGVARTGQKAAKSEEKAEFSRFVRFYRNRPHLLFLSNGKRPFNPSAGRNHLQKGQDSGVLRALQSLRCDRGAEPHPLRGLYP